MGDFFGLAVAAERDAAAGEFGLFVFGDAGRHAGFYGAGADAVDGNAQFAELEGERAGESDDAVLAGRVGAAKFRSAEAFRRGDVYDAPRSTLSEVGKGGANETRVGGEVDGEGLGPALGVVVLVDRAAIGDAGVVDEDVDAAKVLRGFFDHLFDRAFFGDVDAP